VAQPSLNLLHVPARLKEQAAQVWRNVWKETVEQSFFLPLTYTSTLEPGPNGSGRESAAIDVFGPQGSACLRCEDRRLGALVSVAPQREQLPRHARGEGNVSLAILAVEPLALALVKLFVHPHLWMLAEVKVFPPQADRLACLARIASAPWSFRRAVPRPRSAAGCGRQGPGST
jgi:hypothetical protein